MKFVRKYNQFRRDCWCDLECESCGAKETKKGAYDDDNYWENVVPSFKCGKCGKSSKEQGLEPVFVSTKYASYEVV